MLKSTFQLSERLKRKNDSSSFLSLCNRLIQRSNALVWQLIADLLMNDSSFVQLGINFRFGFRLTSF